MITCSEVTQEELDAALAASAAPVPIEQTGLWAAYEATIEGRAPWGCVRLERDGAAIAYVSLTDFETHGYHYLRARHAPVWLAEPSADDERAAIRALASHVRDRDRAPVFLRICVLHDLDLCHPTLSTIPYDTTVVIDLAGSDEDILSRMKPRGRRDVRKALREAPITCADETAQAAESFAEHYAVMLETGARDGFTPAPCADYERMIRMLGPEHCRVFAGRREDGEVVTWSICTMNAGRAMRYYAASRNATMRQHVTDKLVYFECCELARLGCTGYDLMAIGSELAPQLMGLNEFKTKFSREVTHVAPDRDVALRGALYASLRAGKRALSAVRGR